MMNEEFDKIMREKLTQVNTPPPKNGWNNISSEITLPKNLITRLGISIIIMAVMLSSLMVYGPDKQNQYSIDESVDHPQQLGALSIHEEEVYDSKISPSGIKDIAGQSSIDQTNHDQSNEPTEVIVVDQNATPNAQNLGKRSFRENPIELQQDKSNDEVSPTFRILDKTVLLEAKKYEIKTPTYLFSMDKVPVYEMSEEPLKAERKPWIQGVYLEGNSFLNYNRVKPNKNDEVLITNLRNNKFNERLGYSVSLGVHQNLSKKLHAYAGINFQTYISKVSFDYVDRAADSLNVTQLSANSFQVIPVDVERTDILEQRINSVGLETGLRYVMQAGKFKNVINVGILGNTSINQSRTEYIRPRQFFVRFGYGAYYETKSPWVFFAQPSVNYSFLSDDRDSGLFHVQPFSLGLALGVKYNFKRR